MFRTWWQRWAHSRLSAFRSRRRPAARVPVRRLRLEPLENRFAPAAVGPQSLIQSDYFTNGHGHYEALIVQGYQLNHYVDFQDGTGWHREATVANGVTAPASLIQSDWYTNGHGHYEALVLQGTTLNHYVNLQDGTGWHLWFDSPVATGVSGPASLIQSDYFSLASDGNYHRHMEALVLQGSTLNHYVNFQDDTGWHYEATVATGVSAGASFIQSDWYTNGHGHYEALVLQGSTLNHYVNLQDGSGWHLWGDSPVATGVNATASLIQSDYVTNGHGHMEALVLQGSTLNHYVNLQDNTGWHYWETVASPANYVGVVGPASFIQSDYFTNGHGHFEALVQQNTLLGRELDHYVDFQDGTGWYDVETVVQRIRYLVGDTGPVSQPALGIPLGGEASNLPNAAIAREQGSGVVATFSSAVTWDSAQTLLTGFGLNQVEETLFGDPVGDDLALALSR
jgi:hypothetical protein